MNPNDPAFPTVPTEFVQKLDGNIFAKDGGEGGLTKREWFAGMALQGFLASESSEFGFGYSASGARAEAIVREVDALIAELSKES